MNNKEIAQEIMAILDNPNIDDIDSFRCFRNLAKKINTKPVYTKEMHEREELPPIGSEVEFIRGGASEWELGESIYHFNRFTIIVDSLTSRMVSLCNIRPIQTQEEKEVEAIKDKLATLQIAYGEGGLVIRDALAANLHKAGFTLKEGKE